eukprot:Hpha_TRINITY_DN15638_c5_g6::TRINITY_DN15638_c5_g6_i1::g.98334::m.98334
MAEEPSWKRTLHGGMQPPPAPGLSDKDILKLSKQALGDKDWMVRFQKAVGDEEIPDAAKDKEAHINFIKRIQEKMAEDALMEGAKEGKVFEDKDGQWTFTIPEPCFCIKATDESGRKKIFINICKSEAIAEPMPLTPAEAEESGIKEEGHRFRVPISIGPLRADKDKSGKPAFVYDIAVNPMALNKADADPEFKRLLCALCLYGLKQKHETDLNTDEYKTPNLKVKGKPVVQRVRVQKKKANPFANEIALPGDDRRQKESKAPPKVQVVGEEKKPEPSKPGSGTDALWDSYKQSEKELEAEVKEIVEEARQKAKVGPPETLREKPEEKPYGGREVTVVEEGEYDWSHHQCPTRNAYWQSRCKVPSTLVVSIHLPEVQATIRECTVDITSTAMRVGGVDDEDLKNPYVEVEFKFPVDEDSAKAKFVKKKQILTVTLTVQLPNEKVQEKERKEASRKEQEEEEALERAQEEKDEKQRKEYAAKYDRQKQEEKDQQEFNKQLVEATKAVSEGKLPKELQDMVDKMPLDDARTLMARLLDGKMRGDGADPMIEKLPRQAQENMIDSIRERLGLAPRPEKLAEEKRKEQRRLELEEEKRKEEDPDNFGIGGDRAAEKLFGFKFRNRYLFGLDQ